MKNSIKKFLYRIIGMFIYFTGIWLIYVRLGDAIVLAAMLLTLGVMIAQMGDKRTSNKKDNDDAQ